MTIAPRLKVDIHFFLDGKVYAARYWPHVPRVGDEVMFHKPKPPDAPRWFPGMPIPLKSPFKVTRVVWGVEDEQQNYDNQQCVNIEIEALADNSETGDAAPR